MAREGQREANPSPSSSSCQASPSTPPPGWGAHVQAGLLTCPWGDAEALERFCMCLGSFNRGCHSSVPFLTASVCAWIQKFLSISAHPNLFPPASPHQSFIFIPPTHRVCFQRANGLAFRGDEIAQSGGYLKCGAGGKPSPALRSGVFMLNSASDEILPGVSHR